jgi:hypothetical protein
MKDQHILKPHKHANIIIVNHYDILQNYCNKLKKIVGKLVISQHDTRCRV